MSTILRAQQKQNNHLSTNNEALAIKNSTPKILIVSLIILLASVILLTVLLLSKIDSPSKDKKQAPTTTGEKKITKLVFNTRTIPKIMDNKYAEKKAAPIKIRVVNNKVVVMKPANK